MTQFQPQHRENRLPAGQTALTWQLTLIVLLTIALLPIGGGSLMELIGSNSGQSPQEILFWKTWGWGLTALLLLAIVLLVISQRHRNMRADLAPDLLGSYFDVNTVYQVGPVHAVVLGFVHGDSIRILALAQNRFARNAEFRIHAGKNNRHLLVACVPGAAVTLSQVDVPIAASLLKDRFRQQLLLTAGGGGGRLMRFASRRVPTTPEHQTVLAIAQLAAGHITIPLSEKTEQPAIQEALFSVSPLSVLEVPIFDPSPEIATVSIDTIIGELKAKTELLWSPADASVDQFTMRLTQAMEYSSA